MGMVSSEFAIDGEQLVASYAEGSNSELYSLRLELLSLVAVSAANLE